VGLHSSRAVLDGLALIVLAMFRRGLQPKVFWNFTSILVSQSSGYAAVSSAFSVKSYQAIKVPNDPLSFAPDVLVQENLQMVTTH